MLWVSESCGSFVAFISNERFSRLLGQRLKQQLLQYLNFSSILPVIPTGGVNTLIKAMETFSV